MAGTATDIPETGELVFVTERFAAVGGRLEVAGHWRGVRGLRFMRPVLWLHRGGTRRRLIALLDHKPWAAEDGGPWVAAFEWSETGTVEADRAELEVGTGLVVELPVAGGTRPRPAQPRRPTPV
jgi:hypothetical protein